MISLSQPNARWKDKQNHLQLPNISISSKPKQEETPSCKLIPIALTLGATKNKPKFQRTTRENEKEKRREDLCGNK